MLPMAILTRRRLQQMLSDIAAHTQPSKSRDLLNRLENKRVEQSLPAEFELMILWALLQMGEVEVEPEWIGSGRVPEAYTEALFPGIPTVIEVAAVFDAGLAQEDEMRRTVAKISEVANSLKNGAGSFLYFHFGEESGYTTEGYVRRRKVDPHFAPSRDFLDRFSEWIRNEGGQRVAPFRLTEGSTDVSIEWKAEKQSALYNFFCTMPPLTYSLTDNPLRAILSQKSKQLRCSGFEGIRCLLLGDAGSTLLRRFTERDRVGMTFSGRQVIEDFMHRGSGAIDVVAVIAPIRHRRGTADSRTHVRWHLETVLRRDCDVSREGLAKLLEVLPRPRFEGYQARSLQLQRAFSPSARGWYNGLSIENTGDSMKIRVSARALLEVLAGRLTPERFNEMVTVGNGPDAPTSLSFA